jgi:hypothetical protein
MGLSDLQFLAVRELEILLFQNGYNNPLDTITILV